MNGLRPEKFREKVFIPAAQLDAMIERELAKLKDEDSTEARAAVMKTTMIYTHVDGLFMNSQVSQNGSLMRRTLVNRKTCEKAS